MKRTEINNVIYPFYDVEQASISILALEGKNLKKSLWTCHDLLRITKGELEFSDGLSNDWL